MSVTVLDGVMLTQRAGPLPGSNEQCFRRLDGFLVLDLFFCNELIILSSGWPSSR